MILGLNQLYLWPMWRLLIFVIFVIFVLAGCGSGAVVFAPTPLPPDLSPMRYTHPSGAFSIMVPRNWPVFTQHATTLAAASFAPPNTAEPLLTMSVTNLAQPLDASNFGELIDRYQQEIRPDLTRYKEESRQAMGDGSWRMTGLYQGAGGQTRQINTIIERSGSFVGVVEVTLPDDTMLQTQLQTAINTFQLNPDAALEAADASVLVSMASSRIDILNVNGWTTPGGVFYITGEIANYGTSPIVDLPVHAILRTSDGLAVGDAMDVPMGYAILPGGFAPFSLRFGQGQPALTASYELIAGAEDWQPDTEAEVYGPDDLSWIDASSFDEDGHLVVSGTVTNIGERLLHSLRVMVTVFDNQQNVIAARFMDLNISELRPNESTTFDIVVTEIGGDPAQYVVNVQALP